MRGLQQTRRGNSPLARRRLALVLRRLLRQHGRTMKPRYIVTTKATVRHTYLVDASNAEAAVAAVTSDGFAGALYVGTPEPVKTEQTDFAIEEVHNITPGEA